MTTVFRWKNISTVFIRHFALALSRAESTSALLSASRNHLPRVTRRCGNRRRRRRNFSEDSRDLRPTLTTPQGPVIGTRQGLQFLSNLARFYLFASRLPVLQLLSVRVISRLICLLWCVVFDRIVGLLIHMVSFMLLVPCYVAVGRPWNAR